MLYFQLLLLHSGKWVDSHACFPHLDSLKDEARQKREWFVSSGLVAESFLYHWVLTMNNDDEKVFFYYWPGKKDASKWKLLPYKTKRQEGYYTNGMHPLLAPSRIGFAVE